MSNRNWAEAAQAVVAELYGRIPESQPRPRLEPTMLATQYLGMPQHNFGVIPITGTTGKTSTARIAERILRELGLRTGRLTSPHLVSINERVSLDGEPISDETLVLAYEEAAPLLALADEELIARRGPTHFFRSVHRPRPADFFRRANRRCDLGGRDGWRMGLHKCCRC